MATTYSDADKAAYVAQAVAHGYALADINAFLARNVNSNGESDYGRILSALAPNPGPSAAGAPSLPAPNPATMLGAPAQPSDGVLTSHFEIVPISGPTLVTSRDPVTPGVSARVAGLGAPASAPVTPAAFDWTPVFVLAAGVAIVAYLFPRK